MMKIKYHISQKMDSNAEIILDRIAFLLDKRKYIILSVSNEQIDFKDKSWFVSSRLKYLSRIDGGKFVVSSEKDKLVDFYFYISMWPEIFLTSFFTICCLKDYNMLYLSPPILLMLYLKIASVKNIGIEMMRNILTP
jgi:hypothetical protein